jgi:SEC-C motif
MSKIGMNQPCTCGSGKKYKRCCGANAKKDDSFYKQIPLHELWRLKYRARRYLKHLNEEELDQRKNDILSNMTLLTDELKIGFQAGDEGSYWMELFTHLLEEIGLRGLGLNNVSLKNGKNNPFPNYEIVGLEDSVSGFTKLNLQVGKYLIKYGKYKYLEPMLKDGSIRVMPASSYFDPSLNAAIRDNELELTALSLPEEIKSEDFYNNIEVSVAGKKGKLGDFAEIVGNWKYTKISNTDFYVYCLAYEHSYRMFGDFEADCGLVIKNPKDFLQKLSESFANKFPNYALYQRSVKYYDPLNVEKNNLPFYFSKHFGYAYQKEYRVIWMPPEKTLELEPIFLELGNLENCCEIIRLKAK